MFAIMLIGSRRKWRNVPHGYSHITRCNDRVISINDFNKSTDFLLKLLRTLDPILNYSHSADLTINEPDSRWAEWNEEVA